MSQRSRGKRLGRGVHTRGGRTRNEWNSEYRAPQLLKLSSEPSGDMLKFFRFLEREYSGAYLTEKSVTLDLGCGNGRNSIHLAKTFKSFGYGFDTSPAAIADARGSSEGLPLEFSVRSIAEPIPLPDRTVDIALDMMASHVLRTDERSRLLNEIVRVLKPRGWLFYKTFLLDDDSHAARLLAEYPADEPGSYIHPLLGTFEHVSTENEIRERLAPHFTIHKIYRSYRHRDRHGRANKRRSISVYAQKE